MLSSEGTVYIDPYQTNSDLEYISYRKSAFSKNREPHICRFTGEKVDADHSPVDHLRMPVGDQLRTYRLAVAATGEYTAFHGGTVAGGQAAIVTTINRVNSVYERDLSVRMVLIANNTSVVYTNAAPDPYTNSDGFAMLGQNQANLDAVIGSANYDIGHVVSTGGGGIAGLGVVCTAGSKGRGVTGSGSPVGDPFDVDFVAHEIGHQFDGNHTFNGTTGACGGGNRNGGTAYEPGSGTTIQAYAGICGAENIQPNSDDNFHGLSFDEMTNYIAGPGNCFVGSATGNTAPTVNAGAGYTVPIGTPLLLGNDAGVSATDPNGGQVLTYSWEQFDLGAASPPNTDNGNRPIFRSFRPKATAIRYLPQMSDILANTTTLGESLPTTNRTLTFRLTVRDNATGGGGVDFDTVAHTTTTSSGPFSVTSQNTPTVWPQNTSQTITWDVANTTAAPVSCANVTIIFSDQEFANFSGLTIAAVTPNDGSETINTAALPLTNAGRIMVKCANNIFFDVNNADITVTPGGTGFCGDGIIGGPEQCDDGNMAGGDGCSASCQVEPGFTCTGQPSVCTPDAVDGCLDEDFEDGLAGWTVFNNGPLNLDWGTTNDGVCGTVNWTAGNYTGGTGVAACVDSDAAGNGQVESYLCSPQFYTGDADPFLSVLTNYQVFQAAGPDDFFAVLYGTQAPSPATIGGYLSLYNDSANLGAFASLPGAEISGALDGLEGQNAWLCFGYGGNFDWYAQVDDVSWTASAGCGAPPMNNPPEIEPIGDQIILVPAMFSIPITATDQDGDDVTFTAEMPFFCNLVDGGPNDNTAVLNCNVTNPDQAFPQSVLLTATDDGTPPLQDQEIFTLVLEFDADLDGVRDLDDNCIDVPNPDQLDGDGDGYGNLCDGDFNDDCVVNAIDLGIFKSVFFTSNGIADFNGDGIVNAIDLGFFKTRFFEQPGPSSNTDVCNF